VSYPENVLFLAKQFILSIVFVIANKKRCKENGRGLEIIICPV
jgi:hypothetical protein